MIQIIQVFWSKKDFQNLKKCSSYCYLLSFSSFSFMQSQKLPKNDDSVK